MRKNNTRPVKVEPPRGLDMWTSCVDAEKVLVYTEMLTNYD